MIILSHAIGKGKFFDIVLDIVPIDSLYIHEEIVEENLIKLKESLKKAQFLMDPIIIDGGSMVILDGMHRHYALKELGFKYIAVAKVDYFDESIQVKNWFRAFPALGSEKEILGVIKDIAKICEDKIYFENVEGYDEKMLCEFFFKNSSIKLFVDRVLNIWEKYQLIKCIENKLLQKFGKILYVSEKKAIQLLENGQIGFVIKPPLVKKEEVIKFAKIGKVFPPKTTRHILPIRPLFLNIPLSLLKGDKVYKLDTIKQLFKAIVLQKNLFKVKGKVFLDRFYEEDSLFIYI